MNQHEKQTPAQTAKSIEMALKKEERKQRRAISMGAVVAMQVKKEFIDENPLVAEILDSRGFEIGEIPPGIEADECEQDVLFIWRKGHAKKH